MSTENIFQDIVNPLELLDLWVVIPLLLQTGNVHMKFIFITWFCELDLRGRANTETMMKSGELVKACLHRQRRSKCETPCTLPWGIPWHEWQTENAGWLPQTPAVPTGSSLSTSYLWELQNMLNKLRASPFVALAEKLGAGKETASYQLLHMQVIAGAALCEPETLPATHLQKDHLHSHQSFDIISLHF